LFTNVEMAMDFRVFVTRPMDQDAVDLLRREVKDVEVWPDKCRCPRDILLAKTADCDAILAQSYDPMDMEILSRPRLNVISLQAVGTDQVDLAEAAARGIPVAHTPGLLTEACADHAWALLLCAARHLVQSNRYVVSGEWQMGSSGRFLGTDVFERTIGIIGAGRIGQAVARRATGFSMRVLYHGPHEKPELVGAHFCAQLDELLAESDYVVVTCRLTEDTRGLIAERQLRQMKKTAVFVNIARGVCVVTDDLVRALREGWIGAAALDVTDPEPLPAEHPLNKLPNCVVFSHIANATVETRAIMAMSVAHAVVDGFSGKRVGLRAKPAVCKE